MVARRADTLTHTPLPMTTPRRLIAGFSFSGRWVGFGLRSGDMPTRFPWRHLAANGGMMRSAFSECAKTTHSGSLPGSSGWWAGVVSPGRAIARAPLVFLARAFERAASRRRGFGRRRGRVELPGLRSRMLDTTEAVRTTRRTSLRQALTRCVCRMEGARAPGIEQRP